MSRAAYASADITPDDDAERQHHPGSPTASQHARRNRRHIEIPLLQTGRNSVHSIPPGSDETAELFTGDDVAEAAEIESSRAVSAVATTLVCTTVTGVVARLDSATAKPDRSDADGVGQLGTSPATVVRYISRR